ncbi:MAG: CcdB family protein [Deltaproteobacteria bacterium]|nr:CcdB family protein [Deltaproteobacteria bacterium]
MAQFDLFGNPRSKTYPFVLDVQSDLLRNLASRVVAPLAPLGKLRGKPLTRLNPLVSIAGREHAVLFQELAAIPAKALRSPVGNLRNRRDELVAALDLLFTGV